jgi:ribosome-associated heat shock protein Hsp15
MVEPGAPAPARQRLDRWLFFARAVKSRTLAQKLVESGAVRVNSGRTLDTDARVGPGDVLTMTIHGRLLVWRIRDAGSRRGPPTEAATLYEDLSPAPLPRDAAAPAGPRPTKKDRRAIDQFTADEDAGSGE